MTAEATKTEEQTVAKTPATKGAALSDEIAVIETGSKQYVVSVGDVIDVELIGEHAEGDTVEFDNVLMHDDGKNATIGDPYIKGAKVTGTFLGVKKGKKLTIVRFEAKSNRSRRLGHRQKHAQVKIDVIK